MSKIVRVAVVQDAPVAFDRAATLRKASQLLKQAAAENVGLVVFPKHFWADIPRGLILEFVWGVVRTSAEPGLLVMSTLPSNGTPRRCTHFCRWFASAVCIA